ncbi:MAG: type II toxin-antitoxin system VapC family toxin [Chloroflexi bacterium]|nr:type II toxin-antitoxin system VapC family toxin [Chloroflexota bacterium]
MTLLDTHVLLWFAADDAQLGRGTFRAVDEALRVDELAVSAVSFWEIAMLTVKRRLSLPAGPAAFRRRVLAQGLLEVPIHGAIAVAAAELPTFHGDPADRMVVATALDLGAELVTADDRILGWRAPLRTRDARR